MAIKKLLIITYYWPPSGGVGVQRWLHFAMNLKRNGIAPIIYTPANPDFEISDKKLENLSKGIEVIKKEIWEPFGLFHRLTGSKKKGSIQQGLTLEKSKKSLFDSLFVWIRGNLLIPDARVFWIKPSIKFLNRIIQEEEIDCVISTGPPHSMHLIALGLKKNNKDLKWIADFRDPWSDWDILQKLSTGSLAMLRHKYLERQVLTKSDMVLTVSSRLGAALESKVNNKVKVEIVMNGIASNQINDIQIEANDDKFTVGYFGMLNELRNPEKLWEALEKICANHPKFNDRLEIRLGGIVSESILDRIKSSKTLGNKVIFLGYLSHEAVFEEYKRCDVLLLLLNRSDNAKWILPVKFFEYLSARKPILTFGPLESDLGDIISKYHIGEIMSGDDTEIIEPFILNNFEGNYHVDERHFNVLLERHSREHQANELVKLIEKL